MFEKSDVLDVRFTYGNQVLIHKCITKLPKGTTDIKPGLRFGVTCNSDAKTGAELNMTLKDISGDESVDIKAIMLTAEHLPKLERGWYSLVEVKEVLQENTN